MAFARNFGELELPRSGRADVKRRAAPGNVRHLQSRRGRPAAGGAAIRAASTSSATGSGTPTARSAGCRRHCRCSTRIGCHVPGRSARGETEFADLRAGYDALPAARRAEIEDLVALHDIAWSRAQLGFTDLCSAEKDVLPPVPQRLVRTHPARAEKTLYLAAHASEIVDWPLPDGRLLLRELIDHATRREFVYRHEWREGRFGDLG